MDEEFKDWQRPIRRLRSELLNEKFLKERFGGINGYHDALARKTNEMMVRYGNPNAARVRQWVKEEYADWLSARTKIDKRELLQALDNPGTLNRVLRLSLRKGFHAGSTSRAMAEPGSKKVFSLASEWASNKPADVAESLRLAGGDKARAHEIFSMVRNFGMKPDKAKLVSELPPEKKRTIIELMDKELLRPDAYMEMEYLGGLPEATLKDIARLSKRNVLEASITSYVFSQTEDADVRTRLGALGLIKRFRIKDYRKIDEILKWFKEGRSKLEITYRINRLSDRGSTEEEESSGE
jgi:hypothetical protein